jgi:hypothetical protein
MEAMAEAFDVSLTLSEAAGRLNAAGHYAPRIRGRLAGDPAPWNGDRLAYILRNPLYGGLWTYGRHSDKESDIWDAPAEDGVRRDQEFRLECPDLRWWPEERLAAWRAKLLPDVGPPRRRKTEHPRPLRGILACVSCGLPLKASGNDGYACPLHSRTTTGAACAEPQRLCHNQALRALRTLLPLALKARSDWRGLVREELARGDALADKRSKLAVLTAQLEEAAERYYGENAVGTVPEAVARRLAEKERQRLALVAEITRGEALRQASGEEDRVLAALEGGRLERFDAWPLERQAEVYRVTLAGVRIRATGRGYRRRWEVVAWDNLLVPSGRSAATGAGLPASLVRLAS